jgi:RNA polymerase sigma-70 factor (family 1)
MSVYSAYSDQELTALMQEGDRTAYTEVYNRYWALLFRHGRKMLQDENEALDVVQDVFTMLWTKARELEVNVSLSSFLYSAVRNQILNMIKHSKIRDRYLNSIELFLDKGAFVTDDQVRYKEFAETIEAEIAKLPPKMRQVFEMSRKLGLSYNQIAVELNISDETVRKQMHRALKQLRLKLGPHLFSFLF